MSELPRTEQTRVRVKDRAHYEQTAIEDVLDAGWVCHLAFVDDDRVMNIPTAYWYKDGMFYIHGAIATRMVRVLGQGIDCCVCVTHVDGLVLARSMFNHSVNYRSVALYGQFELLEGDDEKRIVLDDFFRFLMPGRLEDSRPPTQAELNATGILRMPLKEAVAKIRTGPPHDNDKDIGLPHWAGELPLGVTKYAPVPDAENTVPVPDYITEWINR